jgi:hypothetical protein
VQLLPDAGLLPITEPPPTGGATAAAQLLGQQSPGTSRPQHEDDASEGRAIWDSGSAAIRLRRFLRQEGLNGFPEGVGDKG